MSTDTPRRVRGTVTRHAPYGFYISFGEERDGVVVVTMISDDAAEPNPRFPPIGATVDALLLGYTELGHEARLSIRPQDLTGR